jgi:hypothetical protein
MQALKEIAKELNKLTSDVLELLNIVKAIEPIEKDKRFKQLEEKILETSRKLCRLAVDVYEISKKEEP